MGWKVKFDLVVIGIFLSLIVLVHFVLPECAIWKSYEECKISTK